MYSKYLGKFFMLQIKNKFFKILFCIFQNLHLDLKYYFDKFEL